MTPPPSEMWLRPPRTRKPKAKQPSKLSEQARQILARTRKAMGKR